jgi:hypothetical protein
VLGLQKVRLFRQKQALSVIVCLGLLIGVVIAAHIIKSASALAPCPCHIFTASQTPTSPIVANDGGPVELGVKFKAQASGYITGIRFYKDPSMNDIHVGNLWDINGNLLASATFSNESTSGWQNVSFTTPVHVTANALYVASFYTPTGKYITTQNYFTSNVSNYPLLAPASVSGNLNGLFTTGRDSFPNNSFTDSNYWVDVNFNQTINNAAPNVSATTPLTNAADVFTTTDTKAVMSQNIDSSSVSSSTVRLTDNQQNIVPATVSYDDASATITIRPNSPLAEHRTYTGWLMGGPGGITNLDGTPLASDYSWSFTTGADSCPCTIWNGGTLTGEPITYTGGNGGEAFGQTIHADGNGYVKAIRFYKPLRSSVSSHIVHIWSTDGIELAHATSSRETDYGWQEVMLPNGVPVQDGKNYIISYYASDNTYVYSLDALTGQVGSGLVHANAGSSVYKAGTDGFPNTTDSTSSNASFWVDAVFMATDNYTPRFAVSQSQPAAGGYGVEINKPLTFKLTTPADSATLAGAVSLTTAAGVNREWKC